jgi:excisionase family DNA binding protein
VQPDRLPQPLLLTVKQVAADLQISESRVYELIARGELASCKIGKSRRIPRDAETEYVTRRLEAESGCGPS